VIHEDMLRHGHPTGDRLSFVWGAGRVNRRVAKFIGNLFFKAGGGVDAGRGRRVRAQIREIRELTVTDWGGLPHRRTCGRVWRLGWVDWSESRKRPTQALLTGGVAWQGDWFVFHPATRRLLHHGSQGKSGAVRGTPVRITSVSSTSRLVRCVSSSTKLR
jgi:hypothetical protein